MDANKLPQDKQQFRLLEVHSLHCCPGDCYHLRYKMYKFQIDYRPIFEIFFYVEYVMSYLIGYSILGLQQLFDIIDNVDNKKLTTNIFVVE